jgi:hypothetical protein
MRKISLPPGFDPRTVQPVASRYANWAIASHLEYTSKYWCLGGASDFFKILVNFLFVRYYYLSESSLHYCLNISVIVYISPYPQWLPIWCQKLNSYSSPLPRSSPLYNESNSTTSIKSSSFCLALFTNSPESTDYTDEIKDINSDCSNRAVDNCLSHSVTYSLHKCRR